MARKRIEKNLAYDDGKKLYYAYFDYGCDTNGNRIRKTKTFADQRSAKLALLEFETIRLQGKNLTPNRITLSQWLNYWLEDIVRVNREYTTYYCYREIVKNHVEPELGSVTLQELAPYQIQQYYTETMREKSLSPNSVRKHHILLHTALQVAYRQGILPENPVDRVEAPREQPARQMYYTPTQLRNLFCAVEGTWLEVVVKLGGYLGLRRGEICGLRWEHIDFDQHKIYIQKTRTTAGNTVIEKPPKTASSARTLGIGELEDLTELLKRIRWQQKTRVTQQGTSYQDSGYVLTKRNGAPRNPNQVTWAFQTFVKENGLPPITIHGLRHTFASVANSAHIPILDIGKALGHRDVSVTGRVYTHIFDQTHQEVLTAVAASIQAG